MEELDSLEWRHIKPLLVSQFSFLVFSGNRVCLLFTHRTFRFLNPCQEKIRKENAVKYAILYTELDDHWSSSEVAKISIYFTSIIGHQQLRLNWTGGIVDRVQIDILELSTDQWPCQSTTWPICYSLLIWETRVKELWFWDELTCPWQSCTTWPIHPHDHQHRISKQMWWKCKSANVMGM